MPATCLRPATCGQRLIRLRPLSLQTKALTLALCASESHALTLADQAASRHPEAARILLRAPPGMEAQLSFRPRISCRRDTDHPPCLLTARAAELKVRAAQGTSTLCESYTCDAVVKPFFNYDGHGEDPTDAREVFLQTCAPPIRCALGVCMDALAVATRSGWLPDGRYKTSIRVFVQGLRLSAAEMNDLLAHGAFLDPGWDKGVYPAPGRLLAVVGGMKSKEGDVRRLEPLREPREHSHYLIQALTGLERDVEVEPAQRAKHGRLQRADDREAPAHEGKDALLLLTEARMIPSRGFRAHRLRGNSVQFVYDGDRKCVHGEFHKGNSCFVNFPPGGSLLYHCVQLYPCKSQRRGCRLCELCSTLKPYQSLVSNRMACMACAVLNETKICLS